MDKNNQLAKFDFKSILNFMKNNFISKTLLIVLIFSSCAKNDPTPNNNNVKYEVSGNASGTFNIVYTNASGALESTTIQQLPWVKEITVQSQVKVVAFSLTGNTTAGKKIVANLYAGGEIKQTSSQIADNSGTVVIGTLNFTF